MEKCVSVIIPSYNRARFLARTIPTYIEDCVAEIIVVDDCSSDNTPEVVRDLQARYPLIRYVRNAVNLRQTGAKNRALELVTQPYIYFGDDDSVLLPGTITYLLEQMEKHNADVMAAVPIYADTEEDLADLPALIARKAPLIHDVREKVDIAHLERTDFFFTLPAPTPVPFTHACALVRQAWVHRAEFDTRYGGNSYREETDYFLSLSTLGARIYFAASPHAAQINLPFATIGRKRTLRSMWRHGKYDILNTLKLIDKHHAYFKKLGYPHSKLTMQTAYVLRDLIFYAGMFPKRIWGMLTERLGLD